MPESTEVMIGEESKAETRIFTRLSIEMNDIKQVHNLINTQTGGSNVKSGTILNTWDILSVETKTEKIFEQLVEKAAIDIIKLDMRERLTWFLNKKKVNEAVNKQIMFEISYGPTLEEPSTRKNFLSNAFNLCKLTKGKNIILTSETKDYLYCRSPIELVAIGMSFGMSK